MIDSLPIKVQSQPDTVQWPSPGTRSALTPFGRVSTDPMGSNQGAILPLHLRLEDPTSDLQLDRSTMALLFPKITSVLNHHSIPESTTYLLMRTASKTRYHGGQIPILTLVIEVSQNLDVTTKTWSQATADLQSLTLMVWVCELRCTTEAEHLGPHSYH